MRAAAHRTALVAVAAAALLAAPAAAQIDACEGAQPFADTVAMLEAEGWSVHPSGVPLPDAAAERLAWALALTYLAGDRGGETPEAIVALQRRAVPGLARKVDVGDGRARVLTSAEGAMILTETRTGPTSVERSCQIATDGPLAVPDGVMAVDGAAYDGAPATLASTRVVLDTLR